VHDFLLVIDRAISRTPCTLLQTSMDDAPLSDAAPCVTSSFISLPYALRFPRPLGVPYERTLFASAAARLLTIYVSDMSGWSR
jgi:hypothetical protein